MLSQLAAVVLLGTLTWIRGGESVVQVAALGIIPRSSGGQVMLAPSECYHLNDSHANSGN